MHTASPPVTDKDREWQKVKGQIISRFGSIKACADVVGCAPSSLRVSILSDLLPGVRANLLATLEAPEPVAA